LRKTTATLDDGGALQERTLDARATAERAPKNQLDRDVVLLHRRPQLWHDVQREPERVLVQGERLGKDGRHRRKLFDDFRRDRRGVDLLAARLLLAARHGGGAAGGVV